ncbi:hypothetical protein QQ045_001538 [Rhodiola kirilowii]
MALLRSKRARKACQLHGGVVLTMGSIEMSMSVLAVYLDAVLLSILPLGCLSLLEVMLETTRKTSLCPGTFSLQLNDEELSKLPGNVTIANGGVLPNIHQHVLPYPP